MKVGWGRRGHWEVHWQTGSVQACVACVAAGLNGSGSGKGGGLPGFGQAHWACLWMVWGREQGALSWSPAWCEALWIHSADLSRVLLLGSREKTGCLETCLGPHREASKGPQALQELGLSDPE